MKHPSRRITLAAVASLAAGTALVAGIVAAAAPADAKRPNTFKLCAYGNYPAYAEIPQQHGDATAVAQKGTCVQIATVADTTYAKVWGLWNTHPQDRFYVGTAHFDGAAGYTGGANGTTAAPTLVNFN